GHGQQQMHRITVAVKRTVRNPDLIEVVAAPDAGAVVHHGKDVPARAHQGPGKGGAAGLDALAGIAADGDGKVDGGGCHRLQDGRRRAKYATVAAAAPGRRLRWGDGSVAGERTMERAGSGAAAGGAASGRA